MSGRPLLFSLATAALCGCTTTPPASSGAQGGAGYGPSRLDPPAVEQEFRAAWVSTVFNIDWPSSAGLSASRQKAELIRILDRLQALKFNAIVLQVRPSCDALYASSIEPWSPWLTGTMGRSPGYDPLAFAVAECHARGMELHAWFNPFRAKASTSKPVSASHVTRRHPEWVRSFEGKVWLDPGLPEVRAYSLRVIEDVVTRYDIDGVHIDDYFYPYPKNPKARPVPQFPDEAAYRRHGGGKDRADWRRANIDSFVESMYASVKRKKPWVKVGISPFGVWRPGVPSTVKADLDPYTMLYADSRKWLRSGWVDYMSPQLYWPIRGDQSYTALLSWWDSQNSARRHVWPGIASERIGPDRPASETGNQIQIARSSRRRSSAGHIHWSVKSIMQNKRGVADLLAREVYRNAAVIPPIRGGSAPGQPGLTARTEGGALFVDWQKGGGDAPVRYVVQVRKGGRWEPATLISAARRGMRWEGAEAPQVVAVTPVDRYGNLGRAAVIERN